MAATRPERRRIGSGAQFAFFFHRIHCTLSGRPNLRQCLGYPRTLHDIHYRIELSHSDSGRVMTCGMASLEADLITLVDHHEGVAKYKVEWLRE